jgi:hypothetical protein
MAVVRMAEGSGRAARWTAAALAAPVVAGVFAATTTWATRVDPLQQNGPSSADAGSPGPSSLSASSDSSLAALRAQLDAQRRAMTTLAGQVTAVRAKAQALAHQKGTATSAGGTVRASGSNGGTSSRSTNSNHSTTSASSSNQAPKPAPPPPTHGSTGASGTP